METQPQQDDNETAQTNAEKTVLAKIYTPNNKGKLETIIEKTQLNSYTQRGSDQFVTGFVFERSDGDGVDYEQTGREVTVNMSHVYRIDYEEARVIGSER